MKAGNMFSAQDCDSFPVNRHCRRICKKGSWQMHVRPARKPTFSPKPPPKEQRVAQHRTPLQQRQRQQEASTRVQAGTALTMMTTAIGGQEEGEKARGRRKVVAVVEGGQLLLQRPLWGKRLLPQLQTAREAN